MRLYFGQYHDDDSIKQRYGLFMRGLPQPILAALFDIKGPILGAKVVAEVEHPDGTKQTLTLHDDGNHDDGNADDGIYGNLYTRTTAFSVSGLPDDPEKVDPQRGSYNVVATAEGINNLEEHFNRIGKGAFQVFEGESEQQPHPDHDDDGMPTRYEELHSCLNPFKFDSREDADGDGLTNGEEWELGTDPCNPDTDGGGESDLSEVKRGADPFDPDDDRLPRPIDVEVIDWVSDHIPGLELRPNSNLIRYPANRAYDGIRLFRATRQDGPFIVVAEFGPDDSALHRDNRLTNGQTYWYYIEAIREDGTTSAPSPLFNGTPNGDPTPPIGHVRIEFDRYLTISLKVLLQLGVDNDDAKEMLISNFPDFRDAKWHEFHEVVEWELEPSQSQSLVAQGAENMETHLAAVYVKFRDEAGNESATYQDDILATNEEETGEIHGSAALEDSEERSGIFVRLLNYLFAPPAFTDVEGGVFFSPLPPDQYDVRFEREGYIPVVVEDVRVDAGQITELDTVVLERALPTYLPVIFK